MSDYRKPKQQLQKHRSAGRWIEIISHAIVVFLFLSGPIRAEDDRVATPVPIRGSGYKLIKNWDFCTTIRTPEALRREFYTRYIYADGTLDHINDEWERFSDNGNHVFGANGLSLVARLIGPLQPGKIESGMLRSKWTGKYGYFEIRMKVPAGRGTWPAFWLNPQDGKWPPEIDILEIVNNGRDTTRNSFHFIHEKDIGKEPTAFSRLDKFNSYRPGFDFSQDFHNYAVEWTPYAVRHYVDNVLVVDRAFKWLHDDGSDGGPAHVLVDLAVGGRWAGPPVAATDFPARLEISYIRVWQKP